MKSLRIIAQIVVLSVVLIFDVTLMVYTIPGNYNICDADGPVLIWPLFILIITNIGFLINSIYFFQKNHWNSYRRLCIVISIVLASLVIFSRTLIINIYYGKQLASISSSDEDFVVVSVDLYHNNQFISTTYDLSCRMENTGSYHLTDSTLTMYFDQEKSNYLAYQYNLDGNIISCNSCNEPSILTLNLAK